MCWKALAETRPALHIGGRKRAKSPRHLGKAEIGQMTTLGLVQPYSNLVFERHWKQSRVRCLLRLRCRLRREDSMPLTRSVVAASLTAILSLAVPASAQERHVVAPAAVAQAVVQGVAQQDTNRATINAALARPEVQQVASGTGIDLSKVAASVATLTPAQLAQAAAQAQQVNDSLAGGASTVTISTTTIIIALLILIIVLVA